MLVIDDELAIRRVVRNAFQDTARVIDAATGAEGVDLAAAERPSLIVLDLGLPDMEGIDVCREIRGWSRVPILVLSARHADEEKVQLLDAGADDYLTKPFDFPELAARVRALLRRPEANRAPVLEAGDIRLDPATHTVWRGNVVIPLTAREFALLQELMARKGDVVRRADLLEAVWDANYDGLSNVVDVHVANLRRKLDLPDDPAPIDTVRGVGYRMAP